jgi:hypothetical protein
MIAMLRLLGLVGLLALALPSAVAHAGANGNFADPRGDNQGRGTQSYAADITAINVRSEDNGTITFAVTLFDESGLESLVEGDELAVIVDQTTPDGDADYAFVATGHGSASAPAPPDFQFCDLTGAAAQCSALQGGTQQAVGPGVNVVTFSNIEFRNWFVIHFVVVTEYEGNRDVAPDSGVFMFDVNADPDADRISGKADKCPQGNRGVFDSNNDGCPDPRLRQPQIGVSGASSGSGVVIRSFIIKNAGAGTRVIVRAPGVTAARRGNGAVGRLAGRRLANGARVTIIYWRPGFVGAWATYRVRSGGLFIVRGGCTPPGRRNLISCP